MSKKQKIVSAIIDNLVDFNVVSSKIDQEILIHDIENVYDNIIIPEVLNGVLGYIDGIVEGHDGRLILTKSYLMECIKGYFIEEFK